MIFKVGDKIKAKKPHACGGREWEVTRTGADVRLTCLSCGRKIFLSVSEAEKMIAVYYPKEDQNA